MFINQILPSFPSLECPALFVLYHLLVPVGQHVPGEPGHGQCDQGQTGGTVPGAELDNSDAEVRVVDPKVVGNAPHDNEVDILLLKLPGDGPASACESALLLIDHHHHLAVAREHFSLVVTWATNIKWENLVFHN